MFQKFNLKTLVWQLAVAILVVDLVLMFGLVYGFGYMFGLKLSSKDVIFVVMIPYAVYGVSIQMKGWVSQVRKIVCARRKYWI